MDSSPPTPTLHHLAHSQSIRVLFALEEFGLPYHLKAYKRVKGRAPPELSDLFPLGKSPILEIRPTESESGPLRHFSTNPNPSTDRTVVTESRLILHHLADHYAPGLRTSDENAARNTYFEEFAMCTFAPVVERILIFDLIPSATPLVVRPITWSLFYPFAWLFKKDLDAPLAVMEDALATQEWFSGRELGIADLCLVFPMDVAAQRGWLAKRRTPRVQAWLARIHAREGYQRAVAKSGGYDLRMFGL